MYRRLKIKTQQKIELWTAYLNFSYLSLFAFVLLRVFVLVFTNCTNATVPLKKIA